MRLTATHDRRLKLALLGSLLLHACGGGVSTPPPPPPPTATQLSVTSASNSVNLGTPLMIIVKALDSSGAIVTSYSGTVSLNSSDPNATFAPQSSTLPNGSGMFSVTFKTAGSQTVTATDSSITSLKGTSNSITVITPVATHFSVVAPSTAAVDAAFDITVKALDASNNLVATYAGTVQFSSNDSHANLPPNSSLMNGTGTFPASFGSAGTDTITVTDTQTPSITGTTDRIDVSSPKAENPVPFLNQPLVPDATAPGSASFSLAVNGVGFVPASVVNWNGKPRATTYVNKSQLKVAIQTSDLSTASTAAITVTNPSPGGGTSNVQFFAIVMPTSSVTLGLADFAAGSLPSSVAVADLNSDGKLDLVVTNQGAGSLMGNVSILLGKGDGTFQAPVNFNADASPVAVAVGDFNGDGKPDLAIVDNYSNNFSVLLGNGDGTFQASTNYSAGTQPESIVAADFNGDGNLDLAVANIGSNTVGIYLGNGDGTFQPALDIATPMLPRFLATGDFNGDGRIDFVVSLGNGNTNNVAVFLGNGDGTFRSPINTTAGLSPVGITSADFNGDGNLDLAIANGDSNNSVSVLLGNGDGTFQTAVNYAGGSEPFSITTADFNGDGRLDLAETDLSGAVVLFLGNGDGTFQAGISFPTNTQQSGSSLVAGDFNGDGHIDLAVADFSGPGVSILLQATTATLAPPALTFNAQGTGTSSTPQLLTLTNSGNLPLSISGVALTGPDASDFGETNNCPSTLSAGANCSISVTFSPSQTGPLTASLLVSDNSAGSPQSASLTGTGTSSGPNASFSPTSLAFGVFDVGVTSPPKVITLTNYGESSLTISNVAANGNFGENNNCASTLAPLASCTINATFTPGTSGDLAGALTVSDDAPGNPQTIGLSGTGTTPTEISLVPSSLNFSAGLQFPGFYCYAAPQTVKLTNTGSSLLGIYGFGLGPRFTQTNNCPPSLAVGQSCTITVEFAAGGLKAGQSVSGSLSVIDSATGSPQNVALMGKNYDCPL